ncbi:putative di-N-acetylchitobiase 2 [Diplonema papillatum]|nr:putative di-N-acetylchitobiase 2 [Diplonema papillatum]
MKVLWLLSVVAVGVAVRRPLPETGRLDFSLLKSHAPPCPCKDASLCAPVSITHDKEVFGFNAGSTQEQWENLDWTQVTTIAWSTETSLVCEAHSHNARVVGGAATMNLTELGTNATAFDLYVNNTVKMVQTMFLDGVTFDYENPLPPGAPEAGYYVDIIAKTAAALHKQVPGSQVSVCVAWSPFNIDGRYYDMKGFAQAADLLYVMMYDTRSQVFEQCIASPNCALPLVQQGVEQYVNMGIAPKKIILGLPWYGYDYPCLPGTAPDAQFCPIKLVPFRGVNCSDAAGSEIPFSFYMSLLNNQTVITKPRTWESDVSTPYFNYRAADNSIHQMWIDDAQSLKAKYQVVVDYGLRGTGPFTFADLDYSTPQAKSQAASMWDALKVFTET